MSAATNTSADSSGPPGWRVNSEKACFFKHCVLERASRRCRRGRHSCSSVPCPPFSSHDLFPHIHFARRSPSVPHQADVATQMPPVQARSQASSTIVRPPFHPCQATSHHTRLRWAHDDLCFLLFRFMMSIVDRFRNRQMLCPIVYVCVCVSPTQVPSLAHPADVASRGPFHSVPGGVGLGVWTAHVTHVGSLPALSIPPPTQGPALVGEWMAVRATLTAGQQGLGGAELEVRVRNKILPIAVAVGCHAFRFRLCLKAPDGRVL